MSKIPVRTFDPRQMIDAGQWAGPGATVDAWLTGTAADWAAPPTGAGTASMVPRFETVALAAFEPWLRQSAAAPAGAPGAAGWTFPRLELPVGESARQFLKQLDHGLIAAWLDRVEATAAATGVTPGRGLLMVTAGDFTRSALDLRHLLSRHNPRKGREAGRRRLALILDRFGIDAQGNWQAAVRLGLHFPVFVLARGIPGVAAEGAAEVSVEALTAAEEIYHGVVGELGTERILFGSGARAGAADAQMQIDAAATWFARPRPWLDAPSLGLLFGANAERLTAADPTSLESTAASGEEPLETVEETAVVDEAETEA